MPVPHRPHYCHCYTTRRPRQLRRRLLAFRDARAVRSVVMLLQEHDQDAFKRWVLPKLETMYVTTEYTCKPRRMRPR